MTFVELTEVVRNIGLLGIAAGGLWLAYARIRPAAGQADAAALQADLARRAHVMQLFSDAASRLNDPVLEVRLAALYSLREIGRDFPDLSSPVFDLLQAHWKAIEQRQDSAPPAYVTALKVVLGERIRPDVPFRS